MLASSLKGVVAQTLCKKNGGGRCAAHEILVLNDAVSAMVREGKIHMIPNHMQTQQSVGNRLMAESLSRLVADDLIDYWEGWHKAIDKAEYEQCLRRKHYDIPSSK